jgi:CheY-like chemotaxis protein
MLAQLLLRGAGAALVVDDEELIRSFTKSALEPYGHRVLIAGDGEEAVRLVREQPGEIALVLLDVAMPEMDGVRALERIRELRPDVRLYLRRPFYSP